MFSSIAKKFVMALSGTFLSLFIVVHAIGNSTVFFGKDVFLSYAKHLHSLGALIPVFEVVLLTIFIVHILLAVLTYFENLNARPERYLVSKTSGGRTLGSRTMPYTGLVLLVFIFIHLKGFHFIDRTVLISDIVRNNLRMPTLALFYILALVALTLHISHGFWSIFQTLGLNHPKYNALIQQGALSIILIIGTLFILIPVTVLLCDQFLK